MISSLVAPRGGKLLTEPLPSRVLVWRTVFVANEGHHPFGKGMVVSLAKSASSMTTVRSGSLNATLPLYGKCERRTKALSSYLLDCSNRHHVTTLCRVKTKCGWVRTPRRGLPARPRSLGAGAESSFWLPGGKFIVWALERSQFRFQPTTSDIKQRSIITPSVSSRTVQITAVLLGARANPLAATASSRNSVCQPDGDR